MHINSLPYVPSSVQTCTTFNNQWFFFYSPRRYFLPKRWLISGTRVSQTTFGWITNSGSYQGSLIHKIFAHSWISEVCKHDVEPRGGGSTCILNGRDSQPFPQPAVWKGWEWIYGVPQTPPSTSCLEGWKALVLIRRHLHTCSFICIHREYALHFNIYTLTHIFLSKQLNLL